MGGRTDQQTDGLTNGRTDRPMQGRTDLINLIMSRFDAVIIPEKVELLKQSFKIHWRPKFSNFFLTMFEQVVGHLEPNGTLVLTKLKPKTDFDLPDLIRPCKTF